MQPIPVAVQLYSVREALEADFFGVLQILKNQGYAGVEFAGFYGHSAAEVRQFLDRMGLTPVSSHVTLDAFLEDTPAVLEYHRVLGCGYLVLPWLDEARRPGTPRWPEVVDQIRRIAEDCRSAGFQLLYHNHDFEFARIDGRYALDRLYEEIPATLLGTEIDTCWVKVAGLDPAAYLRQYAGRSPLVHLKDFVSSGNPQGNELYSLIDSQGRDQGGKAGSSSFAFRPLGMGVQDVPALLRAAQDAGSKWIIVEQDRSADRPPLEAIRLSRVYLNTLGF